MRVIVNNIADSIQKLVPDVELSTEYRERTIKEYVYIGDDDRWVLDKEIAIKTAQTIASDEGYRLISVESTTIVGRYYCVALKVEEALIIADLSAESIVDLLKIEDYQGNYFTYNIRFQEYAIE